MKTTIDKEEIVANNILRQIEFTRTYEDIGVKAAQWHHVDQLDCFNFTGAGTSWY